MIIIRVMSGRLTRTGKLSLGTLLKLQIARFLASRVHACGVPYEYVFPQGRHKPQLETQRPCDVMSQWILLHDTHCWQAAVPDWKCDLNTAYAKQCFVKEIAGQRSAKVLRFRDFFSIWKLEKDLGDQVTEYFPAMNISLPTAAETNNRLKKFFRRTWFSKQ